jgi:hypothetical protein
VHSGTTVHITPPPSPPAPGVFLLVDSSAAVPKKKELAHRAFRDALLERVPHIQLGVLVTSWVKAGARAGKSPTGKDSPPPVLTGTATPKPAAVGKLPQAPPGSGNALKRKDSTSKVTATPEVRLL